MAVELGRVPGASGLGDLVGGDDEREQQRRDERSPPGSLVADAAYSHDKTHPGTVGVVVARV
jgi:hypothetical protein